MDKLAKERRRYDRVTMEELERRRFPRLEMAVDAYAEDENGRRLGVVAHVSGGGVRILLENDDEEQAFVPGKTMALTIVEESGTKTVVNVRVVYVNAYDVGLEFV